MIKFNFQKLSMSVGALSIALGAIAATSQSAKAAIINGGFETGDFTDWNTIGNTSIVDGSFGNSPTEGTYDALLSTGGATVSDSAIEDFLGLSAGSLDILGGVNATGGSAIKQTFTANAGDILEFDWNFLTNEFTPTFFNDFSFVSVSSIDLLADTFSDFVTSLTPFSEETGFQTFSFTIPTSGSYTLGLGVLDAADNIIDSGLQIDNVSVQSTPEPASLLGLLAVGAIGANSALKRKKAVS